ncbi:MAG TPA: hypothetical protein VHI52_11780 [Verrucomicrobiae bacterium]|nr:hypothetical protein [Verrucomicrobiae bacterium]
MDEETPPYRRLLAGALRRVLRRAALRACRDNARWLAELLGSRLSAPSTARERFGLRLLGPLFWPLA